MTATVHTLRGPKSKDDSTTGFPWAFGLAVQLHPNIIVGIDQIGYSRVDVPNGKRNAFGMGPMFEFDYYPKPKRPSHIYVNGTLATQGRWGAELSPRAGHAGFMAIGYRGVSCAPTACFGIHLELKGMAAFSDYMISPVILPAGAFAGTGGLGLDLYF